VSEAMIQEPREPEDRLQEPQGPGARRSRGVGIESQGGSRGPGMFELFCLLDKIKMDMYVVIIFGVLAQTG